MPPSLALVPYPRCAVKTKGREHNQEASHGDKRRTSRIRRMLTEEIGQKENRRIDTSFLFLLLMKSIPANPEVTTREVAGSGADTDPPWRAAQSATN